jgi:hypothetical protein
MKDPAKVVRAICEHGQLSFEGKHLIESASDYRSWTFQSSKTMWLQTFSAEQQRQLMALCKSEVPVLCN